jgi:hypothetical protein
VLWSSRSSGGLGRLSIPADRSPRLGLIYATAQAGPAFDALFSGAQVDRHGVFGNPFWSGHLMASAELN